MRRKIFSIWSVLLVLLISTAVLLPGCVGEPTTATIEVRATLSGVDWQGDLNYTLTPAEGSPISGTRVPNSFTVSPGNWNLTYVSGGPPEAVQVGGVWGWLGEIDGEIVEVGGGLGEIADVFADDLLGWDIFFEPCGDASIEFKTWTIDGQPVSPGTYQVPAGTIVDIEYKVHVSAAEGAEVEVLETDWLETQYMGPCGPVELHTINHLGAVKMSPDADKLSQTTKRDSLPAPDGLSFWIEEVAPWELGVETEWELVALVDYIKSINWLSFADDGAEVLFNADVKFPLDETHIFILEAEGCVEMEGDENPENDCTGLCPHLTLEVVWGP